MQDNRNIIDIVIADFDGLMDREHFGALQIQHVRSAHHCGKIKRSVGSNACVRHRKSVNAPLKAHHGIAWRPTVLVEGLSSNVERRRLAQAEIDPVDLSPGCNYGRGSLRGFGGARIKRLRIRLFGPRVLGIGWKPLQLSSRACHKVVAPWLQIQKLKLAEIVTYRESPRLQPPGATLSVDVMHGHYLCIN